MVVHVNGFAVAIAAITGMIINILWYSPLLFGNRWRKMIKFDIKKGRKDSLLTGSVMGVGMLLAASLIASLSYTSHVFFANSFFQDALTTAFTLWVAINLPAVVSIGLFEQRRKKAILIHLGNQFVSFLAIGIIIGLLQP